MKNKISKALGRVTPTYLPGYNFADLSRCFPGYLTESLKQGILEMDNKIKGFAMADAILTGVETRSSSPFRIDRKENLESTNVQGLYPCAEGAGYAGGIISAAVDGMKCAEAMLKNAF